MGIIIIGRRRLDLIVRRPHMKVEIDRDTIHLRLRSLEIYRQPLSRLFRLCRSIIRLHPFAGPPCPLVSIHRVGADILRHCLFHRRHGHRLPKRHILRFKPRCIYGHFRNHNACEKHCKRRQKTDASLFHSFFLAFPFPLLMVCSIFKTNIYTFSLPLL